MSQHINEVRNALQCTQTNGLLQQNAPYLWRIQFGTLLARAFLNDLNNLRKGKLMKKKNNLLESIFIYWRKYNCVSTCVMRWIKKLNTLNCFYWIIVAEMLVTCPLYCMVNLDGFEWYSDGFLCKFRMRTHAGNINGQWWWVLVSATRTEQRCHQSY